MYILSKACFPLLIHSPAQNFVILRKSYDHDDGNWTIITLLQSVKIQGG